MIAKDSWVYNENKVLDKGFVRLEDALARDLLCVNAARISLAKYKKIMDMDDVGVINFLMRMVHTSPFEHGCFIFHVKAPMFVWWEWVRHRSQSYNGQSSRYVEIEREFHVPSSVRSQIGKPGRYTFEQIEDEELFDQFVTDIEKHCNESFDLYEKYLKMGVAKEQARQFLPWGTYFQFWVTVDPLNLMKFIALRSAPDALEEIRAYSDHLSLILKEFMPVTHEAFEKYAEKKILWIEDYDGLIEEAVDASS